jgi:Tfp pilus assembly protein PilF
MGGAAVTAGRLSTAADSYGELVGLEPGNADLRNNFGIILAQMGDLTGALSQFEAALQSYPAHQAAQRNLEQVRTGLSKR